MLFARLKRIFRLGRLRLRGPRGAQFTLAAIAQNLGRLSKLIARPTATSRQVFCLSSVPDLDQDHSAAVRNQQAASQGSMSLP
jgi:hypothetical protein